MPTLLTLYLEQLVEIKKIVENLSLLTTEQERPREAIPCYRAIKNIKNWKAPVVDIIRNFWSKKIDSLHEALTAQLTNTLLHPENTSAFLPLGKT